MNDTVKRLVASLASKIPINKSKSYVVYTALFGAYDDLKEPLEIDNNAIYICITDNAEVRSDVWEVIVINKLEQDPRMAARVIKLLPHRFLDGYEISAWVDAKCLIKKNSDVLVRMMTDAGVNFACFPHSIRTSVTAEAYACLVRGYDKASRIIRQWWAYKREGFQDDSQLIESTILIRKHSQRDVVEFQEAWFEQVLTRSIRDQLSFNYVAWKRSFSYLLFEKKLESFFEVRRHLFIGRYDENSSLRVPFQRKVYNYLFSKNMVKK